MVVDGFMGTCFGYFWGVMADYKAVAMGQILLVLWGILYSGTVADILKLELWRYYINIITAGVWRL